MRAQNSLASLSRSSLRRQPEIGRAIARKRLSPALRLFVRLSMHSTPSLNPTALVLTDSVPLGMPSDPVEESLMGRAIFIALICVTVGCGRTSLLDDSDTSADDTADFDGGDSSTIVDAEVPSDVVDASKASPGVDSGQTSDGSLDVEGSNPGTTGTDAGSDVRVDVPEM